MTKYLKARIKTVNDFQALLFWIFLAFTLIGVPLSVLAIF
jgi:hypothetical protein